MVTIKSYTDLSQSKTLSKILPLESADMYYINSDINKIIIRKWKDDVHDEDDLPCWSLAALVSVLSNTNILVKTLDGEYYCLAKDIMTEHYDNPIDACYEMVIRLNELKML